MFGVILEAMMTAIGQQKAICSRSLSFAMVMMTAANHFGTESSSLLNVFCNEVIMSGQCLAVDWFIFN